MMFKVCAYVITVENHDRERKPAEAGRFLKEIEEDISKRLIFLQNGIMRPEIFYIVFNPF